jgi:hypothetical protein
MSFGKTVIIFIILALFALTIVGMGAMMEHDKATDSYYLDPNNTVSGSVRLGSTAFGVAGDMTIPLVGIAAILVLGAGMMVLTRKR